MLSKDIQGIYEAYSKMYQPINPPEEVIEEEVDGLVEEVIEELFEECVAEGYTIDEAAVAIEEAATEYLMELNPYAPAGSKAAKAYAKSTTATKRGVERKAAVKGAVERVKAKAKGVKAAAGIAGSIAKDEARRAGRAAVQSVKSGVEKKKKEVKSGIKGFLGKAAKKVASKASSVAARLGEEAIQEADSIAAMRERAAKRRQQRYGKSGGGGRDDFRPYTKADYERGEANDPRKNVKEELEKTGLFTDKEIEAILETQMNEGLIDAAKAGSKRHQDAMKGASRAIKKAGIRTKKLGKALAPAADTAKSAASGVGKAAKAVGGAIKKGAELERKGARAIHDIGDRLNRAKKAYNKEELELIAQIMIDEGYDLSDYTWEEFHTLCVEADN